MENSEKAVDQSYWVTQIKKDPEEFEEYLNKSITRTGGYKHLFKKRGISAKHKKRRLGNRAPRTRRPITAKTNKSMYQDSSLSNLYESMFKGPEEQYSELLRKTKSCSKKQEGFTKRRNKLEYEELEYKVKLQMKLDERTKKVKKCQELYAKGSIEKLKHRKTYEQTMNNCEKLASISREKAYKKAKQSQREMERFYKERNYQDEQIVLNLGNIHNKRLKTQLEQEKNNLKNYNKEALHSSKKVQKINEDISKRRAKSKRIQRRNCDQAKEHYNAVRERLHKTQFEKEFREKERLLEKKKKHEQSKLVLRENRQMLKYKSHKKLEQQKRIKQRQEERIKQISEVIKDIDKRNKKRSANVNHIQKCKQSYLEFKKQKNQETELKHKNKISMIKRKDINRREKLIDRIIEKNEKQVYTLTLEPKRSSKLKPTTKTRS
ncbi:unnamed protein product [Moneuplotes crassus]|uniref:Uncharacterized protein n=1 Tax=Euplotes crassus TaxID=5936 RepID=A0AAD1UB98_EUPCR|nr:unnamed protein product [Moneuplotes crassus]